MPDSTDPVTPVTGEDLITWYSALHSSFGHQGWWPADGWFETIIGAILAQNVSWSGAARAVSSLHHAGLLTPETLSKTDRNTIASLIRSSRFYNQKSERIAGFLHYFMEQYEGCIDLMKDQDTSRLREELLLLPGFGPETVDSILLYACEIPIFVVDAYTRRIGSRYGWYAETATYVYMQDFFMTRLRPDTALYNDLHAQIVRLGSSICKKEPDCQQCPVRDLNEHLFCRYANMT